MTTNGDTPDLHHDAHFWLGYLAANIHTALAEAPENARSRLGEVLAAFLNSPAASNELRATLEAKPRKQQPRPDGYNLEQDWKPCGNPECRAPIPRRSRKMFCDVLCRKVAGEYDRAAHNEEFRAAHPDYDQCPF